MYCLFFLLCTMDTQEIENYQYLMEDMTVLPNITFLYLVVTANGHAFCSYHLGGKTVLSNGAKAIPCLSNIPYSQKKKWHFGGFAFLPLFLTC
jgi:hypothetical protein